jgi:hypothetical protein
MKDGPLPSLRIRSRERREILSHLDNSTGVMRASIVENLHGEMLHPFLNAEGFTTLFSLYGGADRKLLALTDHRQPTANRRIQ